MSWKLISICIYSQCLCEWLNQEATYGHINAAFYRFSQEWTLFFQAHNKYWLSNISFMLLFKLFCLRYAMNFPLVHRATVLFFFLLCFIFGQETARQQRSLLDFAVLYYSSYNKIFYTFQNVYVYKACAVVMLRFMYTYKCFFYFNVHTE
jgi:hypothetical protein